MEELDDDDRRVLAALGYAVARGQLFERGMAKLLEVQRFDVSQPLDDRWDEVLGFIMASAGRNAQHLRIPEDVATDIEHLIGWRNEVVHRAWLNYIAAIDTPTGDSAPDLWAEFLQDQAAQLGRAYNGLMALVDLTSSAPALDDVAVSAAWRSCLPAVDEPPS